MNKYKYLWNQKQNTQQYYSLDYQNYKLRITPIDCVIIGKIYFKTKNYT